MTARHAKTARRSTRMFGTIVRHHAAVRVLLGVVLVVLLLPTHAARAELGGETLLVAMPPGYKIGYRVERGNMVMSEMVPTGETVENWTEMVTVQVFHGLKAQPEKFRDTLQQRWVAACPGGNGTTVTSANENGYPVLVWRLDCPENPQTGKPEITWFKAIAGKDSFYLVQKAFKFTPSQQQTERWTAYLNSVAVCDARITARACPQTTK